MSLLRRLKENWLQVIILTVPLIVIAAAWDRFPDKVAVHSRTCYEMNGAAS